MRWKPDLNLTTNARVFTAIYLGALVMGPPGGAWNLPKSVHVPSGLGLPALLGMVLLGGFVAGIIAGKGHGATAAIVAFTLSQSPVLGGMICATGARDGMPAAIVGALFLWMVGASATGTLGFLGETRLGSKPRDGLHWRWTGGALLALFIYSLTVGPRVALAHLRYQHAATYPAGVYIGVARSPMYGEVNNPTYFTDPTGLCVVGYFCIRV